MQITNPRRFALTLTLLFGLPVALVIAAIFYTTADLAIQKDGEFVIKEGQGAQAVWDALVAQDYTSRALPWRYRAWRADAAAQLKTGTYILKRGERVGEVIERFVQGDTVPDEFSLTFPEGFTLEQMAERVAARGLGPKEEFIAAAKPAAFANQYSWLKGLSPDRSLEGYLFPDTYQVFADDTPEQVFARMLATFNQKVVQTDITTNANRSLDELVTMASIVEREVISNDDMALVAGVLWQRVDDGAGLDADATVRYALKKWDAALTAEDLQSDSPYNTRRWRGLPPGPISNPGLRALTAAAAPEASDFYFYLSAPNGETIFAKTNDEHNANKARYLK